MQPDAHGARQWQGWDTDPMDHNTRRIPGSALSPHERILLQRLCSGDWPGAKEARQQAVHARWGGLQFDDCEDFLIEVSEDLNLEKIPTHPGGPFASLEVCEDEVLLGHLDLWAPDGVLHSVDYMTFDAPDRLLPAVEQLGSIPFASWFDAGVADE